MVTLELTFPANRYHATAWGTHVNEGVIEWPPSPWRLARALIAAWHLKEEVHSEIAEETLIALIGKLSGVLPDYFVPDSWAGHTRHYMPTVAGKKEGSTKVFDAFLHVDQSRPLRIRWECDLSDEEMHALRRLVSKWSYLGRAESLVEASVVDEDRPFVANVIPLGEGTTDDSTKRISELLAPVPDTDFSASMAKLNSKLVPENLMTALRTDTADFKKQGWSQPPGSRWIRYLVPDEPVPVTQRSTFGTNERLPTVARFAVVSDVAPSITRALSIGERVHATVVKCSNGAPIFTGMDRQSGEPMVGHRHAHIFCESTDHRGTVNFLSVYAPLGFDDKARRALEGVKKTWGYGGHDLQMILLGLGDPADFGGTNPSAGQSLIFAESKTWQSVTPFVPTRHAKATRAGKPKIDAETGLQIGGPKHDLRRLLGLRNLPEIVDCEELKKVNVGDREIANLKFQRQRKGGAGRSAGNRGYAFRITFSEAIRGPVVAGYGSHFGLGLFIPAEL